MPVRVFIKIKFKDKEIDSPALVNTGYETESPELMIPKTLAKR